MIKFKSILMILITSIGLSGAALVMGSYTRVHAASTDNVYDISEWQGKLSDAKAKRLSNEVPFVILRVQYGSNHYDKTFNYNKGMLEKYGIPYGVYSYSRYTSKASAAREARDLYYRAPNAKFYVNDFESTYLGRSAAKAATLQWVQTLRPLVGNKKILFYSYHSFMKTYAKSVIGSYDGYWLAAYTKHESSVSHVLWQYTDRYYSSALKKKVDASKLRKDQSWFIGNSATTSTGTTTNTATPTTATDTTNNSVATDSSASGIPAIQNMNATMTISSNATQQIYGDNQTTLPVDTTINYQGIQVAVVAQSKYNGKTYYLATSIYSGARIGWISSDAFNK